MNLLLFEKQESAYRIDKSDPRLDHVRNVLRSRVGDTLCIGVANGPKGTARVEEILENQLLISAEWEDAPPPPLPPIELWIALPRPQTARKILFEGTTIGVSAIRFFKAARSDPAYARSSLWSTDEWRRCCWRGAEQAFDTRLPEVSTDESLDTCLQRAAPSATRWAMDVYESNHALCEEEPGPAPLILALGPERGWASNDRSLLREHNFKLLHLGNRILRLETAALAALLIAQVRMQIGIAAA
ncbi:MAG: RsmE family RNA methyltransferase [Opitutales bacterium]|nr:RsmE family RNA methyltransferase [Opitutales bacterium]